MREKRHEDLRRLRADAGRLLDPLRGLRAGFHTTPAVEVRDRALDADALGRRLERLGEIGIPVCDAGGGTRPDGATFGFESMRARVLAGRWDAGARGRELPAARAEEARGWLDGVCGRGPGVETR